LNCLKEPFSNPTVRRAAALAINRQQYAKVIDINVDPVSNGLFVPGSPYYSQTSYPSYNPSEAKKLVQQVEKSTGKPISFTLGTTNSSSSVRAQEYLQQALQDVGFKVTNTVVEQNDIINDALAGTYEALTWHQFGAVEPDLNYIFWSSTTVSTGLISINMARNDDPKLEAALQSARSTSDPVVLAASYKAVNQRLAIDLPYLWLDRAVWAVVCKPAVQNWNNPKTPAGGAAFGMIGGSIWPTQIWLS
jgi:peptide/nickel transport system substrate-binding protein